VVDLIEEAVRLQQFLVQQQFRFCFIGGLAVQYWGEPRLTRDIDVSLVTGFGDELAYVEKILSVYESRIADARKFAQKRRVLLLRSAGGVGIDIALAALPFENGMVERARDIELLPERELRLCTAEDLIVMKVFAGRETDLRDARSVIVRQSADRLDWPYIELHLSALAELAADSRSVTDLQRVRESVR
jgi:hypothetical protein